MSKVSPFSTFIWVFRGSCFDLLQCSSFVIWSFHFILQICQRHLLINVCSLCVEAFVVRQVSHAYSGTDFTSEFIYVIFVLSEISFMSKFTVIKILNTADFPMLHFIYLSVPPLILTILPRYVNWFFELFWVKSSCCFSTSVAVLVSISSCLCESGAVSAAKYGYK